MIIVMANEKVRYKIITRERCKDRYLEYHQTFTNESNVGIK